MGSIFPPPFLFRSFSVPLSLPSISAASFLHPSLPYTSPIIALEQCQPSVGPQTAGLSSHSVLLLSPWPHLLNTLLVSGSVESHCGLTKEMWDWFLPLQIELKFSSCVCAQVRVCQCVCVNKGQRVKKKSRKDISKREKKDLIFSLQPGRNILYAHECSLCLCITIL